MKDRVHKKHTTKFTTTSNKILQDGRLTYEAIGVFMYLWSMPDDWQIMVRQVMKHNNSTEYKVRQALRELRNYGYMKWKRLQGYCEYDMCEDGSYHCGDIQHDDTQHDDTQHDNIYIQNNNIKKTITEINPASGSSSFEIPTVSILGNVAPVVKESLTVQSVIAGKCKKRTDFSGQNGVKTGTEYTPEFETFWQRYKDLCEKNIETKKNSANAGSKQDTFSEWNKVLKRISPDKILAMIDVYAKYNLEEFAPPKHACRWFSKTIDWEDYENQIAFFQKQLPVLKQAKQPKTEAQKFLINTENRKAVVDTEAVKKQEEVLREYAKVKTEKPEFMEHFKSVLKHYFGGVFTSTIDNLKIKSINANEIVFMLPNKAYVDIMQRNKQKFEERLKREFEGFFNKECAGGVKFVVWKN